MIDNKKTYLIDLDNCLYHSKDVPVLINTLEDRITKWISIKFGCCLDEAEMLKVKLYKKFGGAPRCFIRSSIIKNQKDLADCVNYIHAFKVCGVKENPKLRQRLIGLEKNLCLFTSSHVKYAKQVLTSLGILDLFSNLIDISKVGYSFKDKEYAYIKVFRILNIDPSETVMVDDSLEDLLVANRAGINTCVWVNHGEEKQHPSFVRPIFNILEL